MPSAYLYAGPVLGPHGTPACTAVQGDLYTFTPTTIESAVPTTSVSIASPICYIWHNVTKWIYIPSPNIRQLLRPVTCKIDYK